MHNNYNIYYFIEKLDLKELSNIKQKINVIYRNYNSSYEHRDIIRAKIFCKKKGFKFYLANNIKLAIKLDLDGVYLPSFNKFLNFSNLQLKKKFKIIGSAHNIKEIKIKEKQNCREIFISPLFKTNKHKNYLDIIKFNFIANETNKHLICLGGINSSNIKKIRLTKSFGFASISWIKKNGLNKI